MKYLTEEILLTFDSLPEWEEIPDRGHIPYSDSRIYEVKLTDGFFDYKVKVRIEINYMRWYLPETMVAPEEDDVTEYNFSVEAVSGYRTFQYESMALNLKELEQFEELLPKIIKFI